MGLAGGPGLVMAGVLLWMVTAMAAHSDLSSNPAAGIRTADTTRSPQAWRAGHRAALPWARGLGSRRWSWGSP